MKKIIFNSMFLISVIACNNNKIEANKTTDNLITDTVKKSETKPNPETVNSNTSNKEIKLKIVRKIPKDSHGYTQGLFIDNGFLYESTGQHGTSSLRKIDITTGKVLKKTDISAQHFGEGSVAKDNKIYWITWQSGVCFVFDKATFKQTEVFDYPGEGWGLTNTNDGNFFLSDGSSFIRIVKPDDFSFVGTIQVLDGYQPIDKLNELELINGEIWANIWQSDIIVRIDPLSGKVLQKMDFSFLRYELSNNPTAEVLNGIAYDKQTGKYYITGKYWNLYFEMEIDKK